MTFDEAKAHSVKLELDAWEGLALRLPDAEERRKRFIDFNPYVFLLKTPLKGRK